MDLIAELGVNQYRDHRDVNAMEHENGECRRLPRAWFEQEADDADQHQHEAGRDDDCANEAEKGC